MYFLKSLLDIVYQMYKKKMPKYDNSRNYDGRHSESELL